MQFINFFSAHKQCCETSLSPRPQNDHAAQSLFWGSPSSIPFIISSLIIIIFAVARNSLPWHFKIFWVASGSFCQAGWDRLLNTVGEDPVTLWVYGAMTVNIVVYWSLGALYTLIDVVNKPEGLRRYKIQPGTNQPVDTKRLLKVIMWVLVNQILVTLPLCFLAFHVMQLRGYPEFRELPALHWVLIDLAVFLVVEEIGFYYSHRLLHSKLLYKYIHKKHHEWTAPIAVTAVYCHPIEHVFANTLPLFLGVLIMGSHVATAYLWYTLAIINTLNSHSGYHFPFLPSPEFHDYHHSNFNQNYGMLGILDRLHGTDLKFRNTLAYTRHMMMLNLVPPREMYPDPVPEDKESKDDKIMSS